MMRSEKDILREAERRALEGRTDAEGRVIIPMTVRDDSDFLSPFSEGATPLISTDVAEYLEEKTEELPVGRSWSSRSAAAASTPRRRKHTAWA